MYRRRLNGWMKNMDFRLLDLLSLQIAFWMACSVRHRDFLICFSELYIRLNFLLLFFSFFLGIILPTFENVFQRGFYKEFIATLRHVVLLLLISSLYLFLSKEAEGVSRFTMVFMCLLYLPYSYSVRIVRKYHLQKKNRMNKGEKSLLLVTVASKAEEVLKNLWSKEANDYSITGIALMDTEETGGSIRGIPVVANQESIVDYVCRQWIDEVFICVPYSFVWKTPVIDSLIEMGVTTHLKLTSIKRKADNIQFVEEMAGYTVLTSTLSRGTIFQVGMKRFLDICGGLAGCIATGILFLILGPAIYIQSPGPVLFKQTRIGQNGKEFQLYKFRSMYMDAEERKAELMKQNSIRDGLMFKMENDPRIIGSGKGRGKGIGNFICRYSLDEFPQFFNVLKGDMSLVGTRPPTVDEWNKYELRHRARLAIKPGMTGMWQVNGRSRITDFEEVVRLDKEYIRNWSMGLDLRILLKTVLVMFRKDGSM